jgi:hypothetical protein
MNTQLKITSYFKPACRMVKVVPHIEHIKKAFRIIEDHAEDFENDFSAGTAMWKRTVYEARKHARLEREHTQLQREIEREMRREDRDKRDNGGSWWG